MRLAKTRPDTRPPVADGWAGAEMRVFALFDSCSPTDQRTDQRTDGRTKPLLLDHTTVQRNSLWGLPLGSKKRRTYLLIDKMHTVGTRFNDPEGTRDFWSLNRNVVKSNFWFSPSHQNSFESNYGWHQCLIDSLFKHSCKWSTDIETVRTKDKQKNRETDRQRKTDSQINVAL